MKTNNELKGMENEYKSIVASRESAKTMLSDESLGECERLMWAEKARFYSEKARAFKRRIQKIKSALQ